MTSGHKPKAHCSSAGRPRTVSADRRRKCSLPRGETASALTARLLILSQEAVSPDKEQFHTYIQVGSRQIRPLQIGAAQVGVRQVAAAQIGHLKIDVTQIKSGQIGAAEVKALRTAAANVSLMRRTKTASVATRLPDSGALT